LFKSKPDKPKVKNVFYTGTKTQRINLLFFPGLPC
jgi:hypothetical protein